MNAAAKWSPRAKTVAAFVAGLTLGAFSMFEIVPATSLRGGEGGGGDDLALEANGEVAEGETLEGVAGDGATGDAASDPATAGGSAGPSGANRSSAGGGGGPAAVSDPSKCNRTNNGGSTDQGVTKDKIRMATTVVDSGPGASFQSEMRNAMEAVVRATNRAGGICGRELEIAYQDDGWDAQRGSQYIHNFIDQRVFAIPVGASSEGIGAVIETGDLDKEKMPVVGTDGLEIGQYRDRTSGRAQQWVWPVAAATVASARIMVADAYARGARKFGVVFDKTYKFGEEGAAAFKAEVGRLPGTTQMGTSCAERFCGLQVGKPNYSGEVTSFYGGKPDFVALFLEPETALTWMGDPNTPGASVQGAKGATFGYGAAQPLFTDKFGSACGRKCDQMRVWTGFKPAIESYQNEPALKAYVSAMKSVKPTIDAYNQFSQGAYVGMQLLVQALREVGPNLTRERLREVLNRATLATGLTIQDKLTYTPNTRFTNVTMQGFDMQNKGSWARWRAGPIVTDPRPEAGTS